MDENFVSYGVCVYIYIYIYYILQTKKRISYSYIYIYKAYINFHAIQKHRQTLEARKIC